MKKQDHTEQHLDKLAKRAVKESSLESPSFNFTASVMSKIEVLETNSVTAYRPLISKKGWVVISIFVIAGLGYLFSIDSTQTSGLLDKIDYSAIKENSIVSAISGIAISKILMYSSVLFGLLWVVQVTVIKNLLNRELQY